MTRPKSDRPGEVPPSARTTLVRTVGASAPGVRRNAPDLPRAAEALERFLEALGLSLDDPELEGTGMRVADAFANELLEGYAMDPAAILAETTSTSAPGMVVVTGIATTAMCPHHLLPATGIVHVGYAPAGQVVGLGALARLVHCFARRLVLQEDLGQHVADALVTHLGAKAAGCVVDLEPTCMIARGGRSHGARALTTAFSGESDGTFRTEFLLQIPRP